MSIKGIDSQIMIVRSPDMARDASALLKRPEVAQDVLAAREKINEAQQQTRVAKTLESEMEAIRTDVDGGASGGYEGGSGDPVPDDENPDIAIDSVLYVAPGNNIIDITI